jgi:hypothetical protein
MPAWTRLLQTEIFPQYASRRGELERVGDPFLIAEIGEHDEDAVEFVGVLFEERGAFAGVGVSFDAAELAVGFSELNGAEAELVEDFGEVGAGFGDEVVGEEIAVAVEDAQARGLVVETVHTREGFRLEEQKQVVFGRGYQMAIFSTVLALFR